VNLVYCFGKQAKSTAEFFNLYAAAAGEPSTNVYVAHGSLCNGTIVYFATIK